MMISVGVVVAHRSPGQREITSAADKKKEKGGVGFSFLLA
jgi:hypothetical protein